MYAKFPDEVGTPITSNQLLDTLNNAAVDGVATFSRVLLETGQDDAEGHLAAVANFIAMLIVQYGIMGIAKLAGLDDSKRRAELDEFVVRTIEQIKQENEEATS